MAESLRIAVIAPLRYPISLPHAGGLESAIWNEVHSLRARGHRVVLAAVAGSDFLDESPAEFVFPQMRWGESLRLNDVGFPDGHLRVALPALHAALDYISSHRDRFDIVANHSLQPAVVETAADLGVPVVSTLHTPVLPELVDAHAFGGDHNATYLAVSRHTAQQWQSAGIRSTVVPNAVRPEAWPLGDGGESLIWFGRIVPEKAPHLAIEAARLLGRRITLVGRVGDRVYARREIFSRLGDDVDLIDPLGTVDLAALVGSAACTLVTPVWHEPFGLVIPESLMCGTPVATFGVGGIPEIAARVHGVACAPMSNVFALAAAADELIAAVRAGALTREQIRRSAADSFSLDARTTHLERVFRAVVRDGFIRHEPDQRRETGADASHDAALQPAGSASDVAA